MNNKTDLRNLMSFLFFCHCSAVKEGLEKYNLRYKGPFSNVFLICQEIFHFDRQEKGPHLRTVRARYHLHKVCNLFFFTLKNLCLVLVQALTGSVKFTCQISL